MTPHEIKLQRENAKLAYQLGIIDYKEAARRESYLITIELNNRQREAQAKRRVKNGE